MIAELFDIGEPLEYCAQQVCKFSGELKIDSGFATEAIAIIKGAFGEHWLREIFMQDSRGRPVLQRFGHPLHTIFMTPSQSHIVELYELAIYIKKLLRCPNVDKVIAMMKTQYEEGLMQLAFGYRFMRLGAKNLEFEPEAKEGRYGDILFELDGNKYMVECYSPMRNVGEDTFQELQYIISPIFHAADSTNKALRICIRLKKNITAHDRKGIQSLIIKTIKERSQFDGLEIENDFARVVIEDITATGQEQGNDFVETATGGKLYGNADWGFKKINISADRKTIQLIRDGKYQIGGSGSRIYIWRPDSEKEKPSIEDEVLEIARKIEKKLVQTRGHDCNARRIIIAETPYGRQASAENDSKAFYICRRVQQKIIGGHSGVSALFMCERTWTTSMCYKYMGTILSGKAGDALSDALINKLNGIEQKADWLQDWR